MPKIILTEKEIHEFFTERKIVPLKFEKRVVLRDVGDKLEFRRDIDGGAGHTFRVVVWQSKKNANKFCAGFGVVIGGEYYSLKRYNCAHVHTNALDQTVVVGFHIHIATERYQRETPRIDGYADPTHNHQDLRGAIRRMLRENNFGTVIPPTQRVFNGRRPIQDE